MLTRLIIKNFLLFEEVEISFEKGFHVITGESGSGKTAVVEAIRLLLGERADFTKIRKDTHCAYIEAHFEGPFSLDFLSFLHEASLAFFPEETFILKREMYASGKTKAFVNHHLVTSSFLHTLTPYLIDFVAQHHALLLKQNSYQRTCVDAFGNIDLLPFRLCFKKEKEMAATIASLEEKMEIEKSKKDQKEEDLSLLIEAKIEKENEEIDLTNQHRFLSNQEELVTLGGELLRETEQIEFAFARLFSLLGKMQKKEELFSSIYAQFKEAKILFSEGVYEIEKTKEKWEIDPTTLEGIEKRIATLHLLRKRGGKDPFLYRIQLEKELLSLSAMEEELVTLKERHQELQKELDTEALLLREKREKASTALAEKMTTALQKLQMPYAHIFFNCTKEGRTSEGDDRIELFLQANPGEKAATAREGCSGGELSRLLFVLKCILIETSSFSTLIFDEIDANIGGETATVMGQSIAELGKERQILCITHFPQVAIWADHHLRVYKEEVQGRTRAQISILSEKEKEEEKMRMKGGTLCLPL